jgi:hypothetical protein
VPALIGDLLKDREDESAVAQVARDALERGLLRIATLRTVIEPYATAYNHPSAGEFLRVLIGEAA